MASPMNLIMSPPYFAIILTRSSMYRLITKASSSEPLAPNSADFSDMLVKPLNE